MTVLKAGSLHSQYRHDLQLGKDRKQDHWRKRFTGAYDIPGMITIPQARDLRASFEGDRRMAPFARCTDKKQYMKIHIMCVPGVPEMFTEYENTD